MRDSLGEHLDSLLTNRRWIPPEAELFARSRERMRALKRSLRAGRNLSDGRTFYYFGGEVERIAPADLPEMERLYRTVRRRGGPGSRLVKEGMLGAIASNGSPDSLPFWREALALEGKRDMLKKTRHEFAVAGLALAAFRAGDAESLVELQALALEGPTPEAQGLAARALWLAPRNLALEASPQLPALLTRIATAGRSLLPRYQARLGLHLLERPVPLDSPAGSLTFKAQLGRGFHCLVELPAAAPLYTLHRAIQDGFDWDDDHLYCFYLNGKGSRAFEIPGLDPLGNPFDDTEYPDASEWRLGEVGFVKGSRFTYYFDFGDSHVFAVRVAAVHDAPRPYPLPHITRSGEPPAQYPDYDW